MTQQDMEINKLGGYIKSLSQPNHVMLLYEDPLDIETLKDETGAEEYNKHGTSGKRRTEPTQGTKAVSPLLLRRVEIHLPDIRDLLAKEREIEGRRQANSVICTYDLEKFMEVDEEPRMEILSLHDHVLFTKFTKGGIAITEAMEGALRCSLGTHGAEIVQRFVAHEMRGREATPLSIRGYVNAMNGLLGGGTEPITKLIYRRLFQTMRSSRECE